jgi:Domain of unknown function (DUF5615)
MRLLADMHISPRTVAFLRSLGHDVLRVPELLLSLANIASGQKPFDVGAVAGHSTRDA